MPERAPRVPHTDCAETINQAAAEKAEIKEPVDSQALSGSQPGRGMTPVTLEPSSPTSAYFHSSCQQSPSTEAADSDEECKGMSRVEEMPTPPSDDEMDAPPPTLDAAPPDYEMDGGTVAQEAKAREHECSMIPENEKGPTQTSYELVDNTKTEILPEDASERIICPKKLSEVKRVTEEHQKALVRLAETHEGVAWRSWIDGGFQDHHNPEVNKKGFDATRQRSRRETAALIANQSFRPHRKKKTR